MLVVFVVLAVDHVHLTCCVPRQMEFFEGVSSGQSINGTNTATTAFFKISYDSDRNMVYANGTAHVNGVMMTEEALQDFTTNTQYTVINGKCYKTPIPFNVFMTCLPSDAKMVLSTYYGFGEKTIDIQVYTFTLNGMDRSFTATQVQNDCIPLGEHVGSKTGITDIGIMGLTKGIKNPEVFNIPKPCQDQTTLMAKGMKHTIRRHSVLFS